MIRVSYGWFRERPREDGASSIEYAIIAGGIALVIIVAVGLLGGTLQGIYEMIVDKFPK